jgi:hypothetical protein
MYKWRHALWIQPSDGTGWRLLWVPLFADVELHSYDCQHLDRVTIHHVESLEDSSNVICLRYMHLTTETLTNNVEAEEL